MAENKNYVQAASLYVCGTPIGNLDDMSFRAIQVLKEVEYQEYCRGYPADYQIIESFPD